MGNLPTKPDKPTPPGQDDDSKTTKEYLEKMFNDGAKKAHIDVATLGTGGVAQKIYPTTTKLYVSSAVIQNISTENITLTTFPNITAASGIILNAAGGAGQAGGSISVNNVELTEFYYVRATAGISLAIYYETMV